MREMAWHEITATLSTNVGRILMGLIKNSSKTKNSWLEQIFFRRYSLINSLQNQHITGVLPGLNQQPQDSNQSTFQGQFCLQNSVHTKDSLCHYNFVLNQYYPHHHQTIHQGKVHVLRVHSCHVFNISIYIIYMCNRIT